MYQNGYNVYREARVTTADPKQLVLLCYDEAIRSLKSAKELYLEGSFEAKGKAVVRAQDFIAELNNSLDMEKGGEIAKNLRGLYNFMTAHIIEGDIKRDLKAFDDVVKMLEELKSAWEEIFSGKKAEQPARLSSAAAMPTGRYQTAYAAVG